MTDAPEWRSGLSMYVHRLEGFYPHQFPTFLTSNTCKTETPQSNIVNAKYKLRTWQEFIPKN